MWHVCVRGGGGVCACTCQDVRAVEGVRVGRGCVNVCVRIEGCVQYVGYEGGGRGCACSVCEAVR